MDYRMLGVSGLRVSEIGFGCGSVGGLMVRGSPAEQQRVVGRALELGITYFDTASAYGDGLSETHLGETLHHLHARPLVGTKVRLRPDELGDVAGGVTRSMDASLARLGMEYVDLIQLHNNIALERTTESAVLSVEDVLGPDGVADTFEKLKAAGKVRAWGFTALGDTSALLKVVESGRFHSVQAYYNLVNPSAGASVSASFHGQDFGQIIDRAADKDMGVIVIRVLAAGAIGSGMSRHPLASPAGGNPLVPGADYTADTARAEKLRFLAKKRGQTMVQAAIRYTLMKVGVSTALAGVSSMEQLEEVAGASGRALSATDMAKVWDLQSRDFRDAVRSRRR